MPYEKCRDMLKVLGLLSIQTVHSWVLTIIDEDDICIILRDGRKGHKNNKFYDEYPEIEMKAKAYAIDRASKKSLTSILKIWPILLIAYLKKLILISW
jgi:hypothetical protein